MLTMDPNRNKASVIDRWGLCCHLTLMIVVGLIAASLGVHAAHRGHGGWFAILVVSTFLFVIASMSTHIGLELTYRMVSLGRYLRRYGLSGEGLTSESWNNEVVKNSAEPSGERADWQGPIDERGEIPPG